MSEAYKAGTEEENRHFVEATCAAMDRAALIDAVAIWRMNSLKWAEEAHAMWAAAEARKPFSITCESRTQHTIALIRGGA